MNASACEISNGRARLDVELFHSFPASSYWAKGIPRSVVDKRIAKCLCFGAVVNGRQVAFARVIWDFATIWFLFWLSCQPCSAATGKKLIEFGWDEPDTTFLRTNIEEMAQTPFDGCVFHADYQKADGSKDSFTWQAWGQQAFTEKDLAGAIADLKALRPGKFKYNFLRFNTTPAKLDWFDDYSAVVTNAGLAARVARTGHCSGILFDIEQYEEPLFNYRKQRDAQTKSWELYASQARRCGAEVMQAFEKNYPELCVFLTFGYSLPWTETEQGKKPLADCKYGLLAPFLDGMVQAASGKVRLVDGYEISYGYKAESQFAAARKTVTQDLLPIVREPDRYSKFASLAFGIWLDRDWRKRGWDPSDLSKNYFSPDDFAASVASALRVADQFVWIYSESPHWWPAGPKGVPQAYSDALRKARAMALAH